MNKRGTIINTFVLKKLIEEKLFVGFSVGFIITCLWFKRFPSFTYDDFKVVYSLFVFMVIIKGLGEKGFFAFVGQRIQKGGAYLGIKLILSTALLAMFVTNDVALLLMVPLTLAVSTEKKGVLVILETITANITSCLTPFGNPQNMFIYFHYNVPAGEFLTSIAPLVIILLGVVLLIGVITTGNMRVAVIPEGKKQKLKKKAWVYILLFFLFILSILHILPLEVGLLPILYAVVFDRESLKIDYFLLATFLVFFGFTDNLKSMISVSLNSPQSVFFSTIAVSQVISNVPATLLLSDFTSNWRALLWGASVGGFGGLFGSLATYIAYRLYIGKIPSKKFLGQLVSVNVLFLVLGIVIYCLMEIF